MLKKHSILLGVTITTLLLIISTIYYSGGSQFDKTSVGYSWQHNYISNLFGEKAVNGAPNTTTRIWAIAGMVSLSLTCSLFFIDFSGKIPHKGAAKVIKYFGVVGMFFTLLIATPLHDMMVTVSATIFLISTFYITVFLFKSKLHFFKLLAIAYLLVFYTTMYIYGSGVFLEYLAIMQKVLFAFTIVLILMLHYHTTAEDFEIRTSCSKQSQ